MVEINIFATDYNYISTSTSVPDLFVLLDLAGKADAGHWTVSFQSISQKSKITSQEASENDNQHPVRSFWRILRWLDENQKDVGCWKPPTLTSVEFSVLHNGWSQNLRRTPEACFFRSAHRPARPFWAAGREIFRRIQEPHVVNPVEHP